VRALTLALVIPAIARGDILFVANFGGNTIGEYTTSGATVNPALVAVTSPVGVAVSGSDLFVTSSNMIGEYTTSGAPVNPALITGLNTPLGIAVSGSDLLSRTTLSERLGSTPPQGCQ
jgi:hypothetical protein